MPQMLPLLLPKLRPDGSEGTMTHEVTAPPVTVGETVVMVRSLETSTVEGYVTEAIWSLMVMFIWVEVEPPELLAQMVYVTAEVCRTLGVPLMAPVVELNAKPLGMEGLMAHDIAAPPPMAGVVVIMAVPFSKVKS